MKSVPGQLEGARPGLVPQTTMEIYQLVQQVVGCICFPVPVLSSTKGTCQFSTNIFKREDKSIRDFTRRFGQAVQQIDSYGMDAVLRNFRRSFGSTTPFFHSLSLDPPVTMEELHRRWDKYSTLEDNIRAASQTVMITAQSSKPGTKG